MLNTVKLNLFLYLLLSAAFSLSSLRAISVESFSPLPSSNDNEAEKVDSYKDLVRNPNQEKINDKYISTYILGILKEEAKDTYEIANVLCGGFNIFTSASYEKCAVVVFDNPNEIISHMRYGRTSANYDIDGLAVDFVITSQRNIALAQNGQGAFKDVPYLDALASLNGRYDILFSLKNNPNQSARDIIVSGSKSINIVGYIDNDIRSFKNFVNSAGLPQGSFIFKKLSEDDVQNLEKVCAPNADIGSKEYAAVSNDLGVNMLFFNRSPNDPDYKSWVSHCVSGLTPITFSNKSVAERYRERYDNLQTKASKNASIVSPVSSLLSYYMVKNYMDSNESYFLKNNKRLNKVKKEDYSKTNVVTPEEMITNVYPYMVAASRFTESRVAFKLLMGLLYQYDSLSGKSSYMQGISVEDTINRGLLNNITYHAVSRYYGYYYSRYIGGKSIAGDEFKFARHATQTIQGSQSNQMFGPMYPTVEQAERIESGSLREDEFYSVNAPLLSYLYRMYIAEIYKSDLSGQFKSYYDIDSVSSAKSASKDKALESLMNQ